jgi:hypothetical protein
MSADMNAFGFVFGWNWKGTGAFALGKKYRFKTKRRMAMKDFDGVGIGWQTVSISPIVGSYSSMSEFMIGDPVNQLIDMSGWDWGLGLGVGYGGFNGEMELRPERPAPAL